MPGQTDALKHALTDEEPENIIGGRRHNINEKIISNTAATSLTPVQTRWLDLNAVCSALCASTRWPLVIGGTLTFDLLTAKRNQFT